MLCQSEVFQPGSLLKPVPLRRQAKTSIDLIVAEAGTRYRNTLEAFIHEGFSKAYGAQVRDFLPVLVGVGRGKPEAALGIRKGTSPLFVEQYLSAPLETVLEQHALSVPRKHIAEIGNLYSASPRFTIPLLLATAMAMCEQGVAVLVFSATDKLRQLLSKNGVKLSVLAKADPSRLAPSQSQWGRYYDSQPQVVAFSLEETFALFAKNNTLSAITDSISLAFPAFSRTLGASL
ncbi:thermostable hemolysin [Alteromonas sp. H39]|uniref:thermostable hemolysin n=1 Tax=Alteromonas sp. H39 TaxID=3389876 RepID=UPI0039E07644